LKINYLKINEFGNIKNKEIEINKNINLIYGKNESGKSTLLKFIECMFYGISKNKNGKEISDFDKYKPWYGNEFSGKIKYTLDNKEEYEVFRDFIKKNPKIYNNKSEDISKLYSIDKNKGNQFFYEQTNIDEALYLNTNIIEQQGVILNENNQNLLTQKIANILSSGDDNTSYKKIMDNLNKKLIQEVGTDRTTGRPLNEINYNINLLKEEKNKLNNNLNIKDIRISKKEITENIKNIENEIKLIKEIKEIKNNEEKEREKIIINKNINNENEEKINNLKNKINIIKNNKKNKTDIINTILLPILIILNIIINLNKFPDIFNYFVIVSTISYLIINLFVFIFKKNNKKNIEQIKIENEIEILTQNKKDKEKEIIIMEENITRINNNELNNIKNKFKEYFNELEIINLFNKRIDDIDNKLELLNKELNNKKLELNTISLKEIEINNQIDRKIQCEEKLEYLEEQKQELLDLEKSINIAKEALENSYIKIKNEITPKFTKNLSLLIEKISSKKYKKASFDAEYGLRVENENGEYIDCNRLSIGTLDQLYLSLRLSAMNEISKEKMPIILDESFAYYDNERLENILKFLNDNYQENQILIFTCSNREKEILEKLNINYGFVEL